MKFQKSLNENGLVTRIELGGFLVLSNSQSLKQELVGVIDSLFSDVELIISEVDEFDLSCIQVLASFINAMTKLKINYTFSWEIEPEQKQLLENIGLSNDFF